MAYHQHYNIFCSNPLGETLEVVFYRKDVTASEIVSLKCKSILVEYREGNESKYDWLIPCNATIIVRVSHDTPIDNETFLSDYYDEWKVVIKDDDQIVFTGFIEPSQGGYLFKGKPYDVTIRATDGLKLLSESTLSDVNGDEFNGLHTLMEYVAGALTKTNTELPIRLYCNIYEIAWNTRSDDIDADFFNQGALDYRTFLKSPGVFCSCLEALEIILKEGFKIFQWNGKIVIVCIPEQQFTIGPEWYYTDYSYIGESPVGALEESNQCEIGKHKLIQPIDLSGLISWDFPVKSVKHSFKFDVIHNLIDNENINRKGDLIAPLSGVGYSAWELVDWSTWEGDPTTFFVYGGTKNAYIKTTYDAYNVEQDRFFVIEYDSAAPGDLRFQIRHDNSDFFVKQGDKISISAAVKTKQPNNVTETAPMVRVVVFIGGATTTATNYWSLKNDGTWQNDDQAIFGRSDDAANSIMWKDNSVTDSIIPATGIMYIYLGMGSHSFAGSNQEGHYKFPSITYKPYLVGSNESVKGDHWLTSQDLNVKGSIEETVGISDSPRQIIKGSLYKGTTDYLLTTYEWGYADEPKVNHYKSLLNYGRYNLGKRRYKKFNGTFKGVKMQSENEIASSIVNPLGFHKHFKFVEDPIDRYFVLVPPLSIDYTKGRFTGTFSEVMKDADDYDQDADTHQHNYDF